MTTVQRNYELSEATQDLIEQAKFALAGEVAALGEAFAAESSVWQSSDAGGWVAHWLESITRLRGALTVEKWDINPLTDGCTSFDEAGNEIDDEEDA